jgi:hypothetical protein
MGLFRPRYTVVDHENGQKHMVGGPYFVLNPAANFVDYLALLIIKDNVEPELAASLTEHLAMLDQYPDRNLSKYGRECLPHIKHPMILPAVVAYCRRNGIVLPSEPDDQQPVSPLSEQ